MKLLRHLGLLVFWLSWIGCGHTQEAIIIDGRVEAIESGNALLIGAEKRDTLGISTIVGNEFRFNIQLQDSIQSVIPAMLLCVAQDRSGSVSIPAAIENQNIEIIIDANYKPIYSGTPLQHEFSNLVEESLELNMQLADRVHGGIVDSVQNMLSLKLEDFYIKHQYGKLKNFISMIVADAIIRRFVDPSDFIYIADMCTQKDVQDAAEVRLCEAIANYKKDWEGTDSPAIQEMDQNGHEFNLDTFIGKKIIILDFWASWCGPCIREMPELRKLYEEYNVEIVGISIDAHEIAWKSVLTKLDLPWIHIRDTQNKIAKQYQVSSVPTKFVIDKMGRVVARNPEDLRTLVSSLQ